MKTLNKKRKLGSMDPNSTDIKESEAPLPLRRTSAIACVLWGRYEPARIDEINKEIDLNFKKRPKQQLKTIETKSEEVQSKNPVKQADTSKFFENKSQIKSKSKQKTKTKPPVPILEPVSLVK